MNLQHRACYGTTKYWERHWYLPEQEEQDRKEAGSDHKEEFTRAGADDEPLHLQLQLVEQLVQKVEDRRAKKQTEES